MTSFKPDELFLRGTSARDWHDGVLQSGAFRDSNGCSVVRLGNRPLAAGVVSLAKERQQAAVAVTKAECDAAGALVLEAPSKRNPNHCLIVKSTGTMRLTTGQARKLAKAASARGSLLQHQWVFRSVVLPMLFLTLQSRANQYSRFCAKRAPKSCIHAEFKRNQLRLARHRQEKTVKPTNNYL